MTSIASERRQEGNVVSLFAENHPTEVNGATVQSKITFEIQAEEYDQSNLQVEQGIVDSSNLVAAPGGGNRLFGRFRLNLAREVFGDSIVTVSHRYGVSPHTWQSYESGRRRLPDELRMRIEDDVRDAVTCSILSP